MSKLPTQLEFFINLAKAQAMASRRFDVKLSQWGLGLSDFLILYHLHEAQGEKLRRIDLAEKIGLTASGVTRLLAPMEKIGLVQRETAAQDARVSFVTLAPGGKRLFNEALETAHYISEEWLSAHKIADIKHTSQIIASIGSYIA